MKCDAMPLVYVRILVAGLRWSPKDKSNAGILYPRIWWAHRRVWILSASGRPRGQVGQWGADRCWNLSASGTPTVSATRFPAHPSARAPGTDAFSPPARARSCRFFFPRHFFLADISSHCIFFRARKAGTDPDLILSPGKENSIDKNSDGARV